MAVKVAERHAESLPPFLRVLLAPSSADQGWGKGGLPEPENASGRIDRGDPHAAGADVDAEDESIHQGIQGDDGAGGKGIPA